MIQLTSHTAETQQTHHLQRTEEAADALQEMREVVNELFLFRKCLPIMSRDLQSVLCELVTK